LPLSGLSIEQRDLARVVLPGYMFHHFTRCHMKWSYMAVQLTDNGRIYRSLVNGETLTLELTSPIVIQLPVEYMVTGDIRVMPRRIFIAPGYTCDGQVITADAIIEVCSDGEQVDVTYRDKSGQ
jgi:hypothetical protein